MDKEREENLQRKVTLCEEAEGLADSTDWDMTTNKLKRLQARWKEVGPVPRKVSDEIWRRFRGACDKFFDRRSRRDELPLEDNLHKKEEALAALEALLPGAATEPASPPADEAEASGSATQAAAEDAAPAADADASTEAAETAPKSEAEATGEAESTPEAQATDEAGDEKAAEASSQEPEAAAEQEAPSDPAVPENLAEVVRSSLADYNNAGEIPSSQRAAIDKRYSEVSGALMSAYAENLEGTPLDPAALAEKRSGMLQRAQGLLTELKAEVQASKDAPEPSLADLAQQLKEAFAANTIRKGVQTSGPSSNFRKARRKLEGLRERWNELPGQGDEKAEKSFEKILKDLAKLEKENEG